MTTAQSESTLFAAMAPGTYALLGRLSAVGVHPAYEIAYALSCANGGLDEGPIKRSAGASFNPRPARICQILLQECQERDFDTLSAGLLISSTAREPFPAPLQKAAIILSAARNFFCSRDSVAAPAERVALALHLDTLRHLHMSTATLGEIHAVLEATRSLLLDRALHDQSARLKILIRTCFDRALQRENPE